MIRHWVTEKFASHQYFGGDIETFVSDPLVIAIAVVNQGSMLAAQHVRRKMHRRRR